MDALQNLKEMLEQLEAIIDVDHVNQVTDRYKAVLRYEKTDSPVLRISAPCGRFQWYSMEEIHADPAKMMFNELISCFSGVEIRDDSIPMIRANFGVGILPSMFGLDCEIVNGGMPWVKHASMEELKAILNRGIPDLNTGFGSRLIETYEFYRETLRDYPKCREAIKLYAPDYQGPFDLAHLMMGPDIFMEMYDDDVFIHELLDLVTETYIAATRWIRPYLTPIEGFNFQWGELYGGELMLRNDSAVCVSADMYQEFVQPYDRKLLDALGGGSIHFCGKADQWVRKMIRGSGCRAMNFGYMKKLGFGMPYLGQLAPDLQAAKMPLIGYFLDEEELEAMDFGRYSVGVAFSTGAPDVETAREIYRKYAKH